MHHSQLNPHTTVGYAEKCAVQEIAWSVDSSSKHMALPLSSPLWEPSSNNSSVTWYSTLGATRHIQIHLYDSCDLLCTHKHPITGTQEGMPSSLHTLIELPPYQHSKHPWRVRSNMPGYSSAKIVQNTKPLMCTSAPVHGSMLSQRHAKLTSLSNSCHSLSLLSQDFWMSPAAKKSCKVFRRFVAEISSEVVA